MRKYLIVFLSLIAAGSIAFNVYQHFHWISTYEKFAAEYRDSFESAISYLDEMKTTSNPTTGSIDASREWFAAKQLSEKGAILDMLVNKPPSNMSILQRVGTDLLYFNHHTWLNNGIKGDPAPNASINPLPSSDSITKLHQVFSIYRKHFTDSVIWSRSYQTQRQALLSAHKEIKEQGLDSIITIPGFLDSGIN